MIKNQVVTVEGTKEEHPELSVITTFERLSPIPTMATAMITAQ
jgi:hypothetical protein